MHPQEQRGKRAARQGLGGRVRQFVTREVRRALDPDQPNPTPTRHPEGPSVPRSAPELHPVQDSGPLSPAEPIKRPHEPASPSPPAASPPETPTDEPRPQPTQVPESPDQSGAQPAADADAERVGLLHNVAGLCAEWQRVQGTFVDDPHRAVQEASMLVNRTLDEIRANVESKHPSETMSTDELRTHFHHYREFFQRLLSA